ncbi:hypothetical protein B0H11DRAFT_1990295 [Mycena galericulata]|nr:hypothetical protein B0H11DRAFT_2294912 [Mycena galericulata]KAJ7458656.1 hypothetical protein B0H11DRAFT_2286600 [Mycena galericulata]KAJ7502013.1 hypothetical protein B0H11DRAFT_1990295 [Mycena galericulata]
MPPERLGPGRNTRHRFLASASPRPHRSQLNTEGIPATLPGRTKDRDPADSQTAHLSSIPNVDAADVADPGLIELVAAFKTLIYDTPSPTVPTTPHRRSTLPIRSVSLRSGFLGSPGSSPPSPENCLFSLAPSDMDLTIALDGFLAYQTTGPPLDMEISDMQETDITAISYRQPARQNNPSRPASNPTRTAYHLAKYDEIQRWAESVCQDIDDES